MPRQTAPPQLVDVSEIILGLEQEVCSAQAVRLLVSVAVVLAPLPRTYDVSRGYVMHSAAGRATNMVPLSDF